MVLDPQHMWTVVLTRDASFDGRFVYAVRSTRIYCLPSCPSRRPRQSQAVFFSSPEEARDAGYRACKRCQPDRPCRDSEVLRRAGDYIDEQIEHDGTLPSVAELAEASGVGVRVLRRAIRQQTGLTPMQYARVQRLRRFKLTLRDKASVTDSLYDAGYGSSSRAYEKAVENLGMTPATYLKGGSGAVIRYIVTGSVLGELLVAGTSKGVCAVKLGDDAEELICELRGEFPAADVIPIGSSEDDLECDGLGGMGQNYLGVSGWRPAGLRLATGRASYGLSMEGLAKTEGHPTWPDTYLPAIGRGNRPAHSWPRRWPGLRL